MVLPVDSPLPSSKNSSKNAGRSSGWVPSRSHPAEPQLPPASGLASARSLCASRGALQQPVLGAGGSLGGSLPCAGFPALGELCQCHSVPSCHERVASGGVAPRAAGARLGEVPEAGGRPPRAVYEFSSYSPAPRGARAGGAGLRRAQGVPAPAAPGASPERHRQHRARLPRPSSALRAKQAGQNGPVTFTWDKGSEGSLAARGAAAVGTAGTQLKWKRGKNLTNSAHTGRRAAIAALGGRAGPLRAATARSSCSQKLFGFQTAPCLLLVCTGQPQHGHTACPGLGQDVRPSLSSAGYAHVAAAAAQGIAAEPDVGTMKLLENSSFEAINSQLTVETGDAHIIGRWVPSWSREGGQGPGPVLLAPAPCSPWGRRGQRLRAPRQAWVRRGEGWVLELKVWLSSSRYEASYYGMRNSWVFL